MRKFVFLMITSLIGLVNNSHAEIDSNLPEIISNEWILVEKAGEARFKKLGLHIYDASFWSLNRQKIFKTS